MKKMSFGKKSTNITSINDGGIICGATSSSASSDGPHPLPHVSEAGDEEIMISSGTKRTRSVIESDNDDNDSVDDNNSSFTLSCTTNSSGKSKVNIFDV